MHRGKEKSMFGTVKWYKPEKGYGFIEGDDGKEYFVPYCNVKTVSGSLCEGYSVEFTAGKNERGYIALNVRLM